MSRLSRFSILWVILLLAASLRLWRLDTIPPGFHFDESFEGVEAWRILTDASYRPIFLSGNFGVPPFNAYANAVTFGLFRLFGAEIGPLAMRTTAAFFGVLGVFALYCLGHELKAIDPVHGSRNTRFSLLFPVFAAASLAVMRWHLHFSRIGIEPIIVPLIWATATTFLLHGWRTGNMPAFIGCGITLALAMYTYQGAWIIPLLVALTALHLLVSEVEHKQPFKRWLGLVCAALVATVLVLPLAWFFWQHADLLLLRPTQIAVGSQAVGEGQATIWDEVWATAKMFGPLGAPGDLDPRRNVPGLPALDFWMTLPFYIGILISLLRLRNPRYAIPLTGLVGLLLPGVFSEYAPHFHRILGASAPAALLCAIGLDWLSTCLASHAPRSSPLAPRSSLLTTLLPLTLLLASGITTSYTYFVRWAALPDRYYAFDEGLWQIGQWMAAQPSDQPLYLSPRTTEHPTLAFALQTSGREQEGSDGSRMEVVSFDGRSIFPLSAQANLKPEVYVTIEHEDFRTRLLLPEIFPNAQIVQQWQDATGAIYATAYLRPPQSQAQRPPQIRVTRPIGDGIRLLGYDVQPAQLRSGEMLYLQLHWEIDSPPTTDWTVFTHLFDPNTPDAPPLAGKDSLPGGGSLPTTRWQTGWRVLDEYQIALPVELAAGVYGLRIGLYTADGKRLPIDEAGLDLGTVHVE